MDLNRISFLGFNALLNTLSEQEKSSLLELMPIKERENMSKAPKVSIDLIFSDEINLFLEAIHPSWLHFIFEKYSEKDRRILAKAFKAQHHELCTLLNIHENSFELTRLSEHFIKEKAYFLLIGLKEEIDPIYTLKQKPFFELLEIPSSEFDRFLILLSLYDLKEELKTLIDKNKLKTIQDFFSKKEHSFLKKISKQKQLMSFSSMGLNHWNGKVEDFYTILKTRGLNRLAKWMTNASQSFNWHLFLLLSIDDAKILKKLMVSKLDLNVEKELEMQIKEVYNFFQQNEEP
jgi:RNA polymerase-interacting CarD/CdnL/TRCF family regulator